MPPDNPECDCTIYPYSSPECFDYCTGRILRYAKPEHLKSYLKLDESLAEKIFELTSNENIRTLSDFKPLLTPGEYDRVEFQLKNMTGRAVKWMRKKALEREGVVAPA